MLDAWKFTNALVAHTHIAMAGLVTSLLMLVLVTLNNGKLDCASLSHPLPFTLWHLGTVSYTTSMLLLGITEAKNPTVVYFSQPVSQGAYIVRLCSGLLMTASSAWWFSTAWRAWLALRTPSTTTPNTTAKWKDAPT